MGKKSKKKGSTLLWLGLILLLIGVIEFIWSTTSGRAGLTNAAFLDIVGFGLIITGPIITGLHFVLKK